MAPQVNYTPGSLVRCRGREWVVLPPRDEADDGVLLLRPLAGSQEEVAGVYLPLVDQGLEAVAPATFPPPDLEQRGNLESARLLWDAARLALRNGAGPFRSLGQISVRPRAYQYVPLLMALRLQPVRLLIADDVGIGKTIEAGLIARELLDRGEIRRICVLCPPYLAEQWQAELHEKFHLDAAVVRGGTATALERALPPGADSIFGHYRHLVVSIDYAKLERHSHSFLAHCPDFVIVDEAHGAASAVPGKQGRAATLRHRLVAQVASNSKRHLLLLTATPHSGYGHSFSALLGLLEEALGQYDIAHLSPEQVEHLAAHFIQRRRGDVKDWLDGARFPERIHEEATYELSEPYRYLFRRVYSMARNLVAEGEAESAWARRLRYWGALGLLRSVMSSPAMAAMSLRRRSRGTAPEEAAANAEGHDPEAVDALAAPQVLDSMDQEASEDAGPFGIVETGEAGVPPAEARRLRRLAAKAEALQGSKDDRKLVRLLEIVSGLLDEGYDPIVWCRFIATSDYVAAELQSRLKKGHRGLGVRSVTGALAQDERRLAVKELAGKRRRVLVATDCLSEGINLQDAFTAVVHYDLPWNPNRLEQREGRVDRFGQKSPAVKAVLLYGLNNAVDGAILDVLLRKARQIYDALGTHVPLPASSASVLEPILRYILIHSADGSRQLELSEVADNAEVRRVHEQWEADADREKENRARFAQQGIQPQEVAEVVAATDSVLGDPRTVERFVTSALRRLKANPHVTGPGGAITFDPADLPEAVRRRLPEADGPIRLGFDVPAPPGAEASGRQHPLTAALAGYLLEGALEGIAGSQDGLAAGQSPPAARTALVRTGAVARRTTVLLLRLRYLLDGPSAAPMLAEEVVVRAFRGPAEAPEWLADDEARGLLEAEAAANVTPQEARDFIGEALAGLPALDGAFAELARLRARGVEEAHQRVRHAAGLPEVRAEARPAPDVLGLYVLLPVPPGP